MFKSRDVQAAFFLFMYLSYSGLILLLLVRESAILKSQIEIETFIFLASIKALFAIIFLSWEGALSNSYMSLNFKC